MEEVRVTSALKENPPGEFRRMTIVFVAIAIFLSIDPFFVWQTFAGGIGIPFFKIIQILAMILMVSQLPLRNMRVNVFSYGLLMIGIFFFYSFFTGVKSGTTHPLLIGNILIYLFYALNVMTDRDILIKSFELLRKIFAIVLAYTLVIHVLLLLRVPIPYQLLQSGEAGRAEAGYQYYHNYLGCILINQSGKLMYRFTSVFTEPGVVGTFCAFFLAASGCHPKTDKRDLIFLISGILSFSVAFYVMLIIICAIKALRSGGYKVFTGLLAIVVVYAVFMNVNFSNSNLIDIQERLEITETGLAGDNRIKEAAEKSYQAFLESDTKTVLLGYGYPDSKDTAAAWQSTASYKESIYALGFLGYGLLIAWFILAPIACYKSKDRRKNKLMYSYMAIFIMSQYQRPYMKALFLAYILLAGCLYVQQSEDNRDNHNV